VKRRIGVCSWSLQPESPADLIGKLQAAGVDCVQLALEPLRSGAWPVDRAIGELSDAGVEIRSGAMSMKGEDYSSLESIRKSGGVRPDEHWKHNLDAARANAQLAKRIGIKLVTFHAGFLPHERSDRERAKMLERLRALADAFAEHGVRVGFETGQESAETLLGVLEELGRDSAGVNFDPANMILYDTGDPVDSLKKLAGRVLQVHVKDARKTKTPGTWGEEVRAGDGEVDWNAFFRVMRDEHIECDLMIERETGGRRTADIAQAHKLVLAHLSGGAKETR
jgi:sugar phosphate isomerase/epimerase